MLGDKPENLFLEDEKVKSEQTDKEVSLGDICSYALYTADQFQIQAQASNFVEESPPPFIAQFAEVDVDVRTGEIELVKFVSAVDCGQPINPVLVEGQVEGATVNGISYALCEEYLFDNRGRMTNPNFWDYKIYNTLDLPEMQTFVVDSYEESGPFGAKSVAEIAINGPAPAIANAIYDAVGVRIFQMPITPEKVFNALQRKNASQHPK